MVDGVLASNYANVDHDMAQVVVFPMQWLPKIMTWIFGEDRGFPAFVSITNDVAMLMMPEGQYF